MKFLCISKGGVQSSKLLENFHWLLDFPSPGMSMVSLRALNSPIVQWLAHVNWCVLFDNKSCNLDIELLLIRSSITSNYDVNP